jgi:predicted oxidoreductase
MPVVACWRPGDCEASREFVALTRAFIEHGANIHDSFGIYGGVQLRALIGRAWSFLCRSLDMQQTAQLTSFSQRSYF